MRVSAVEIARIAAFLGRTEQDFIDRRINPVKPDKCRTFPYEWTNDDSDRICPGLRQTIYHNDNSWQNEKRMASEFSSSTPLSRGTSMPGISMNASASRNSARFRAASA